MSKIEALKEQARRHEQKEEWQQACDLYLRAIERLDEDEQPDIGLYNRVGDLLIRLGNFEQAVDHFERATDLYLEAELPNNAIAVCKKVLRHLPSRTETYLRMGKIRATQGFLLDARGYILEYAERTLAAGDTDEALGALVEFADLAVEDVETRMTVALRLLHHGRTEDALHQLRSGYVLLTSRGEEEQARAFAEKILEIDPQADLDDQPDRGAGPDAFPFQATSLGESEDEPGFEIAFGEIDHAGLAADDAAPVVSEAPEPSEFASLDDDGEGIGGFAEISFLDDSEGVRADSDQALSDDADTDVASELPFLTDEFGEPQEEDAEPLPFLSLGDDVHPDPEEESWEVSPEPATWGELNLDGADAQAGPVPGSERAETRPSGRLGPREQWAELRQRLGREPGDVEMAQELVEVAFQLGEEALLTDSYMTLAAAFRASGQDDRSAAVLQQVLALNPEHPEALALVGETFVPPVPVDTPAETQNYVDLAALIFDDEGPVSTRFQVAYEEPSGDEAADFARMLGQFKAKVAENFDHTDVKGHHDLGTAYREMGLLDEAVEKFQQALRASPDHLPTLELLGQTFLDRGEFSAAVRVLERALKVSSQVEDELVGIYYYLGRAHEGLSHNGEAVEFYERVFSLDINFADVTARLRRLRA